MMFEPRWVKVELFSAGLGYEAPKEMERSLGFAIFVVATEDYGSIDPEIHADARDFLFPPTADWKNQFDWAVSLAEGLNPGWLRDALNRSRFSWDQERADRLARISLRQSLRKRRKANGRKTSVVRKETAVVVRGDRVAV
jgi:hypothetical protein